MDEKSRFLNIMASIGNYVIILDVEGKVTYCNKNIEKLFDIPSEVVRNKHFSLWLRKNRELVYDLTKVY